ncbi:MAG: MFS transporter [Sphingomonas sp.]
MVQTNGVRSPSPSSGYQIAVLLVLAFVNGVVALDRLAVNFLSPFIIADLGLTNAQLGLLSSALSVSIAISGLIVSAAADAAGQRKRFLVISLIGFSVLSAGSGLASSFGMLVIARLLLGIGEGPMIPLAQSVMSTASSPERRGFNMGAMQIGGAFLIGAMLGPVIAVAFAERFGWQAAFFASAVPGLIGAALIALVVKPVPAEPADPAMPGAGDSWTGLLRSRNLLICMAISGLITAWLTIQNVFMPVYLTQVDGFTPSAMSMILGVAGVGGLVGGLVVPALSDRFGRKPVIVAAEFASVLAPLAMLFLGGSAAVLAAALAIGWLVIGSAPLVIAIVPGESVAPARVSTAIALTIFSAEMLGGVVTPPLAGWAADIWGLDAPFWIAAALALCCGVLALFLTETAPRALARRRPHP